MSKIIYFDLDGTLYNLYQKPNWLEDLREEKAGVFSDENLLMVDFERFYFSIMELFKNGYQFGVISWLPMQASIEYEEICRKEKIAWIAENLPFVEEINIVPYGTPKQLAIQKRRKEMVLIDDNMEICQMWNTPKQRHSYHVSEYVNVVDILEQIIEKE